MIHQGSAGFQGTAADIEVQAREILRIQKRMEEIYAFHTGSTIELIRQDLSRDFWMGAQETVEYGIVDQVVGKPAVGEGLQDTPPSTNPSPGPTALPGPTGRRPANRTSASAGPTGLPCGTRGRATTIARSLLFRGPFEALRQRQPGPGDHAPERPDVHGELVGRFCGRGLILVEQLNRPTMARIASPKLVEGAPKTMTSPPGPLSGAERGATISVPPSPRRRGGRGVRSVAQLPRTGPARTLRRLPRPGPG